jgi:hypothetical protein
MTIANAEFIRAIGLDPDFVTDEPITVMPIDHERVMVNYSGFIMITPQQLAVACDVVAARRPVPEVTDG